MLGQIQLGAAGGDLVAVMSCTTNPGAAQAGILYPWILHPVGLAVLISWGCTEVVHGFVLTSVHFSRDTSAGKKHHALLFHFYLLA